MKLYHLDLKVTMYKKEYIKNWFQKLKENGFNAITVEIDNKLVFPSHPDFAAPDALSAEEWKEIVRFGKSIGLVVYPLLQTIGHMEHILSGNSNYTNLAENPGNKYMLCPSKEETLKFIKELMFDLFEVFDKPERIHLGGDEVYGHMNMKGLYKCPLCTANDPGATLNKFFVSLARYAAELGMRPEFWADEVLAFPEFMDNFPKETVFVDWNYQRYQENEFEKSKYLLSRGFEVIIASAVRSYGDCYALPRIDRIVKNAGMSDAMSNKLGCSHMVTSWAVRLSHPETTWPGIVAASPDQAEAPEEVTRHLGGISLELYRLLEEAGKGLRNIDITTEDYMRYQRPYYDDYIKRIYEIWSSDERDSIKQMLDNRIDACRKALPALRKNLEGNKGDRDCLRHWISGIELSQLRSEQACAILDHYSGKASASLLNELLERNHTLLDAFTALWSESVTDYSLQQEIEIKLNRDIRILENLICK